jgi:crotonobetainyl-CoA:carnitine CoA-transferase CaiB-like acyl-CoA transferase
MFDLLKGVKIIDVTAIVLGPYSTQLLADMGADVVKVEPLEGDTFRYAAPSKSNGMGSHFLNCNRNKRSISIDLKSKEGKEVLSELVKDADVVVHNMRPKAANKLGLLYDKLRQVNNKIIFCEAWGFGQEGPYKDDPAFDEIVQSIGGFASLGSTDSDVPSYVPTIICDKVAGLYLAQAILGALYKKSQSGEGMHIEIPMFEANFAFLMLEHLSGHTYSPPIDDLGYKRVLSRKPVQTKDGWMTHGVYTLEHWKKFLTFVERFDLLNSEMVESPAALSKNLPKLYSILAKEIMALRTTEEWINVFQELDIPYARINTLESLMEDPHLKAVSMIEEMEHPTEGKIRSLRIPYIIQDAKREANRPAPNLGEHSVSILTDLGYDKETIDKLTKNNVIKSASSE